MSNRFPPHIAIEICGGDDSIEFSTADTLPENNYCYISEREHKATVAERDRLKWIVEQYKVWGTNQCNSCEYGRITLFYANGECTECNPASYENPFDRPAKQTP